MIRVLKPGGMIVVSAPMDFHIHAFPDDYWRLTPSCLNQLMAPLGATLIGSQGVESHPHTVLALGCKSPVPDNFAERAMHLIDRHDRWCTAQDEKTPRTTRAKRLLRAPLISKGERRRQRDYHKSRFLVHVRASDVAASPPPASNAAASSTTGTRLDII
jgi:hypothetical protein